ncbi:MAG: hypothetical protein ABIZ36_13040, partial [Gemmatimonadaceae bacterium]
AAGVGAAIVIGAGLYMAGHGSAKAPALHVALKDRVQLTNTGNVSLATISDDGKMLAYVVTTCSKNGCRYAIDLKDVGGSVSRRVVDGATAIYDTELSPDRRNLLFLGSVNQAFGTFFVSLLGGAPRFMPSVYAAFFAGGDSLIMSRVGGESTSSWMLVSGLDGIPVDSVRVDMRRDDTPQFIAIPGTSGIVGRFRHDGIISIATIDRHGKILSSLSLPRGTGAGASVSRDAVWLHLTAAGPSVPQIVRVPFDPSTMQLAQHGDTVFSGGTTGLSVTDDGGYVVLDEGSSDYTAWALPVEDIVNDRFTDDKRLVKATGGLTGSISPDGAITLVGRSVSQGGREYSVIPYGSTTETPIPGRHNNGVPQDSVTIKMADLAEGALTLFLYNIRTRQRSSVLKVADPALEDFTRLGNNAWVWIPSNGRSMRIQRDGESGFRELRLPARYKNIYWVSGSKDGSKIAFVGWQAPGEDSIGVGIWSVPDNRFTQAFATFGESSTATWLDDGGLFITIDDTPESVTLYRMRQGGRVEKLGSTPRVVAQSTSVTVSSDLKRAFMISRDDRRDVWMSKVVK